MDLWVVAAAAGAGYVAKYLKKTKQNEGLAESFQVINSSSSPFFDQLSDDTCLGRHKLLGDKGQGESIDFGSSELTSTSGFDDELLEKYGSNEDCNLLSLSILPRGFPTKSNYQENSGDIIKGKNGESDQNTQRRNTAIRSKTRCRNSVKPLNSLDSCLIAHLCNEHVGMEEYVFTPFPSPSPSTMRPLIVTDGSRIISRANSDSCSMQCNLYKEDSVYSGKKETMAGVPSLPGINRLQLPKKPKHHRGQEVRGGRLTNHSTRVGYQLHPQGPSDRMFAFCLGVTFGVMSTVMANKTEVDKLNELLKQTESLVQDLQEELEMKDSLTVKVLTHEGCESQEINDPHLANQAVTSFSSAKETYESVEYDIKRTVDQNSNEDLESMSKIEAELEAELERLELNVNTSSFGRRLSGLVELDPDSVADFVQGELRVDMVNGEAGNRIESSDTSGTSTTQRENVNYAVSPQELSLRLHEVIQSRLEERIVELESALESSQKRLHYMEPKQTARKNYSASEIGSSSQASPVMREECNPMEEPLFLNLSGDALDAYNEAYEALNMRIAGINEESPPFMAYKSNLLKEDLHSSDRSVLWSQSGGEEKGSGSNGAVDTEDESDDDEMARLLIKQLVEKTRQGSPVVFNAQRMLFSRDEKSQLK